MLATAGETIARDDLKPRRRAAAGLRSARREMDIESFAEAEGGYTTGRKRTGVRLTFHGGLPETVWGRVAAGAALLGLAAVASAGVVSAERLVSHDRRFVLADNSAISIAGLHHLSRVEVLRTMNSAVGGNIFRLSLEGARARLEAMPWVEHATVMRLLPDHLSAVITERTPVAFARNGNRIDLVDASGVLLGMGGSEQSTMHYSFPVVTGIIPSAPLSVRGARMKLFGEFTSALDAGGDRLSAKLSEVDLSDPEDIKAVVPENGADILVHFGEAEFLQRFRRFEKLLPEWRAQYPKLSSVDMRYERQVVLEMQPGAAIDSNPASEPAAMASAWASSHPSLHPVPSITAGTTARATAPHTRVTRQADVHHSARAAAGAAHHGSVPR